MVESLQLWLYQLEHSATQLVESQLQHLSLLSFAIVLLAGLMTSLSPCMLSMLPITVGYIGGYSDQRWRAVTQSAWFAVGLASTLTVLGLAAVALGQVYGQMGSAWTVVIGGVAILMGLNLLEIVPLRFPNWFGEMEIPTHLPQGLRSFLLGLTFGLVASPCSTPVLVALLGWVSTTGNPTVGAGLLFAYALGLVSPLVLAGSFTAVIKRLLSVRQWSGWLTYASGALLVGFGTMTILARLV